MRRVDPHQVRKFIPSQCVQPLSRLRIVSRASCSSLSADDTRSGPFLEGADMSLQRIFTALLGAVATFAMSPALAQKQPNVVILMTDDVGWNDFGYISGGGADLGHPTPNIDRIAKEGAYFTSWYGQASCTAG